MTSELALSVLLEALLIGLATGAVLAAWFKQDGPFASWKAYTETLDGWLGRLLGCPICLPFHIAFLLVTLTTVPSVIWPWLAVWLHLPLLWLAATAVIHAIYTTD